MKSEKRLVIIGAGGHGRVALDIAKYSYSSIVFLDDSYDCYSNNELVGKVIDYKKFLEDSDFFIAIGNNIVREKIFKMLESEKASIVSLIHPKAVIGCNVKISRGSIIVAGAVVNTGSIVGEGCIINTCSSVDHDCIIAPFCHISVGAHLAGTVKTGERTLIGAGVTVINNISICADCLIGAGAVVVNDIEKRGTYIGVPAKEKL